VNILLVDLIDLTMLSLNVFLIILLCIKVIEADLYLNLFLVLGLLLLKELLKLKPKEDIYLELRVVNILNISRTTELLVSILRRASTSSLLPIVDALLTFLFLVFLTSAAIDGLGTLLFF
jgi:hypothetical protein